MNIYQSVLHYSTSMSKRKNDNVTKGAIVSSLQGPKSGNTAKSISKEKRIKKTNKVIQPIEISGQDLENLDPVLNYIKLLGITTSAYKKNYLIKRTRARIRRLRLKTYKKYLEYLKKNPNEIKALEEALSINVTRFFRNEDTYKFIKDNILPSLLLDNKLSKSSEVKIWSAGCAVGAEPYSIAILCSDKKYLSHDISILATDLNNELLAIAKNGVYSSQYLAEVTPIVASKIFSLDRDSNYKIKSLVKKLVRFQRLDLINDPYPKKLDVILCRNVLIYIDPSMQEQIIEKFYKSLKIGGIIILGRAETLRGKWKEKFDVVSSKHRVYKKAKIVLEKTE